MGSERTVRWVIIAKLPEMGSIGPSRPTEAESGGESYVANVD